VAAKAKRTMVCATVVRSAAKPLFPTFPHAKLPIRITL
jgi:hypothetical protein